MVAEFFYRLGVIAEEQIGQMLGAETLAGAHDGGERFLRRDRAVDHLGAVAAEVAIAARLRRLAEIGQKRLPAAARRFAQRDQRVEPLAVDALLRVGGVALVDLQAAQANVAHAVERQRVGRQPVAAGAADFLVVAFDIGRHVGVKYEAHIRLVDAHAERDGRDHDDAVLLQKNILIARARRLLHAGMIGQRLDAALAQEFGELLGFAPRGAIDDAALPAMAFDEIRDLLAAAGFGLHRQPQVGPVEAVHEHRRRTAEKLLQEYPCAWRQSAVAVKATVCTPPSAACTVPSAAYSGRKSWPHCEMQCASSTASSAIFGALEEIERFGFHQAFGRDVDETQFTARDPLEDRAVLEKIVRGVQARRRNAIAAKLRHLIAHERDQRRHHDGQAVANKRRKLVAQRFAAAGRHDREHIAAIENSGDDFGLAGPERLEPECAAQTALR